jgi:hypothetical protein
MFAELYCRQAPDSTMHTGRAANKKPALLPCPDSPTIYVEQYLSNTLLHTVHTEKWQT